MIPAPTKEARRRWPYRSLVCAMIGRAYRDSKEEDQDVDWGDIPWVESVDVRISQIRKAAND